MNSMQYLFQEIDYLFIMPKLIENYSLNEQIGSGAYGKVYKAKHLISNEYFAVKVISIQKFKQNEKLRECFSNQKNTLTTITPCKHIIKYISEFRTQNNLYFVYEYCNGGTLEAMLKREGIFSQLKAINIFKQLLQAFKVLNEHKIIHRDVKPQNILFHNCIVKLADFGFCKGLDDSTDMTATMLGSPIYMAPQVLKGEQYTNKIDIWSLGAVLYEMLFGICPFQSKSIVQLISTIRDTQLKFPLDKNNVSEQTQYIIRRMLVKQVEHRIRWQELFEMILGQSYAVQEIKTFELQKSRNRERDKQVQKLRQRQMDLQKQKLQQMQKERQRDKQRQKQKQLQRQRQKQMERQRERDRLRERERFNAQQRQRSVDKIISIKSGYNLGSSYEYPSSLNPSINKISFETLPSLPFRYQQTLKNSKSFGLSGSAMIHHPSTHRKTIVQQHQFCTRGIKASIDIIDTADRNSLSFSYLTLSHVKTKLKKIKDSISANDSDFEDIFDIVANQLIAVERSVNQLRLQLENQNFDLKILDDAKIYLSIKFRQFDCNIRVWYEMVNLLLGDKSCMNVRDKTREQMLKFIKKKLQ